MKNLRRTRKLLGSVALSISVGLVASVAIAAPDAKPAAASKPGAGSPLAKPGKPAPPPDAKTEAKVSVYISMINRESGPIFESRSDWLSKIDEKTGPTCKESGYGLRGIDRDAEFRYEGYRKKLLAKPKLEVDEAALKMVEALEALRKPYEDNENYFSRTGGDKQEKCEKAKALHPLLVASWNKYVAGHQVVRAFVDKYTDERDVRELESTAKKYGKHYRYHFARLVSDSKALLRTIAAEAEKADPDPAPIREKLMPYVTLVEDSKKLMDSDPAAKKGQPYPPGLTLMLHDSVPRFQKAVERYLATVDNKAARNRAPQLKSDWTYVVDNYNKVVDQMNGVRFDKKQK